MDKETSDLLGDPELTPQFTPIENPQQELLDLDQTKILTNWNRVENLLRIAIPGIIQRIFFVTWEGTTIIFIGQFTDSTTLSAVGLANMWINVTTAAVIMGIRDALQTCCAIEIGKGNPREAGLTFHKGLFMAWGVAVIMLLAGFKLEDILVFFGQDPVLSAVVGKSIIWYSIYMFPYAFDCALSALLQSQHILKPQNYAMATSMIVHPLWCYIFICHLKLGAQGAGLTYIASGVLSNILLCIFAKISDPRNPTMFLPTRDSFRKYRWVASVTAKSSILLCLQLWIPEVGTFMVGLLNKYQLAAHICGYQIQMFFCTFPNIIQSAAITLTGNYIGQGNKREFRKTFRVAILLGIIVTLASIITVLPFRSFLAKVVSSDPPVIQITYDLLPFVFLYVFFDGAQTLIGSVFKALGRYGPALFFLLINCYFVGVPFSWLFGLNMRMGANGVWLGFVVGFVGTIIFYGIYVWRMDFDLEIDSTLRESDVNSSFGSEDFDGENEFENEEIFLKE